MAYEFYYWPWIQGRGEVVRLALEYAGVNYVDIGRGSEEDGQGVAAIRAFLESDTAQPQPYAPPFLKVGELVIAHAANILMYLGDHHALAPSNEAGRLYAHQLQLTVTDFVKEIHDTHHPIANAYILKIKLERRNKSLCIFWRFARPNTWGTLNAPLRGIQ